MAAIDGPMIMATSLRRIPMPASTIWTTIAAMRTSLTVVMSEADKRYGCRHHAEGNRSSRIHLSEEPLPGADLSRLAHDLRLEDSHQ